MVSKDISYIPVSNCYIAVEDFMGDDLSVVNTARVSFNKKSDYKDLITKQLKSRDIKLIKFLAREGHTSPFRHQFVRFRVKAPIFVIRQWAKHQIGCAWNEASGRYIKFTPEFFEVDYFRGAPEGSVKQGSSGPLQYQEQLQKTYKTFCEHAYLTYTNMLEQGVCKEQARMILPHSLLTEFIFTASLQAICHFLNQRLDSHSQYEIRLFARAIWYAVKDIFPVSIESLVTID